MTDRPRKAWIDGIDAEIILAVALVVLATPFLVAGAIWRFLRRPR